MEVVMTAIATVKGGFWPENGVSTLTQASGVGASVRRAAQALATKGAMARRELMETLNGAAAGSAALKTLSRVAHSEELGGVRTIETETLVDRNTTAADEAAIDADVLSLSTRTYDPTPVANLDGNPLGTR